MSPYRTIPVEQVSPPPRPWRLRWLRRASACTTLLGIALAASASGAAACAVASALLLAAVVAQYIARGGFSIRAVEDERAIEIERKADAAIACERIGPRYDDRFEDRRNIHDSYVDQAAWHAIETFDRNH